MLKQKNSIKNIYKGESRLKNILDKIDKLISERVIKVVVVTVIILIVGLVVIRTVDDHNKQEKLDNYIGEMQEPETTWEN